MAKVNLTQRNLKEILAVISENEIDTPIVVIEEGESGIGSILSVEFKKDLHGREASIRIEISGVNNW